MKVSYSSKKSSWLQHPEVLEHHRTSWPSSMINLMICVVIVCLCHPIVLTPLPLWTMIMWHHGKFVTKIVSKSWGCDSPHRLEATVPPPTWWVTRYMWSQCGFHKWTWRISHQRGIVTINPYKQALLNNRFLFTQFLTLPGCLSCH